MSALMLLLTLLSGPALASPDTDVTSGVVAAQKSDWTTAISQLSAATADPSALAEENVAKAWFWLGESRLGAFREAGAAADTERLATLSSAPLEALDAFEHARATDTTHRWDSSLERSLKQLEPLLLQGALSRMQEAQTSTSSSRALADARVWADAAVRCSPGSYIGHSLRGQIGMKQGRNDEAAADLNKAAELYISAPPESPDPLVAYVHHSLAVIRRSAGDIDGALGWLDQGLTLLEQEEARGAASPTAASDEERRTRQTSVARSDLESLRLDTLLNAPTHRERALTTFAAAVEGQPNDYMLRVAYAQLLMPTDTTAAAEQLEAAIAIDPTQVAGAFNLAALYQNEAARLAQAANETEDPEEFNQLQEEVKFMMMKARPHFETAWALDPTNISVARALEQITLTLGDDEAAKTWRARRETLLQP